MNREDEVLRFESRVETVAFHMGTAEVVLRADLAEDVFRLAQLAGQGQRFAIALLPMSKGER